MANAYTSAGSGFSKDGLGFRDAIGMQLSD